MTSISAGRQPARTAGRSFYLVMSLAMAAVIVAGFSRTVPGDFTDEPALPWLLHLHGAIFTLWVLLFVAQPAFVARGSIGLHRRIGYAGAGLAAAMVAMGIAATFLAIRAHRVPSVFPAPVFLVMNVLGIFVFGGLVAAGVALRRRVEWHRRLMLCATISITAPGLARLLPLDGMGSAAPLVVFGGVLLFASAGPVRDRIVRGRIHPAYMWGVAAIVFSLVAVGPLAGLPPVNGMVAAIRG